MNGFYYWLQGVLPLKRILISLGIGLCALAIVLYSGLNSDFVRAGTVAARGFYAFAFTGLSAFILMMSCEEYAIFKTKRELESIIADAALTEATDFNLAAYRAELYPEPVAESEAELEPEAEPDSEPSFRPIQFS